jgi:pSer/pThr/pTyr-binding forkhead associated (FHA) protein
MNFCKMCGESLRGTQVAVAPTAPDEKKPQPRPRSALPSALAAVVGGPASGSPPSGPTIMVPAAPPPASARPGGNSQTVVARKPAAGATGPAHVQPGRELTPTAPTSPSRPLRTCASCGGSTPVGFAFCQHCGAKVDAGPPARTDTDAQPAVGPATLADAGVADTLASADAGDIIPLVKKRAEAGAGWARLVSLHRDGSDAEIHPVSDDAIDLGRGGPDGGEAALTFDDRFLALRHARVQRRGAGGAPAVTPLEPTNGVYFRLRPGEICPIVDGDHILVGKEVLRFEVLDPEERGQTAAMQHGVRLFGSPLRSPWARLRQIVQSGVARDIYHLCAAEVTLGREEGDLRFSDDEFMSRRHARIANRDGRFEIVDLESSNGTFVRVRGERVLKRGDHLRMGDQLFRFEMD